MDALLLLKNEDDKHVRQMWRYGRLFSEEFLPSLRPSRVGNMYMSEDPIYAENSLQLKQLEEISAEDQERCRLGALKIVGSVQMSKKDAE